MGVWNTGPMDGDEALDALHAQNKRLFALARTALNAGDEFTALAYLEMIGRLSDAKEPSLTPVEVAALRAQFLAKFDAKFAREWKDAKTAAKRRQAITKVFAALGSPSDN